MRAIFAALILVLLAPASAAGLFDPVTVHVAPYRAGDLLRMEEGGSWTDSEGALRVWNDTDVVLAEGPARAIDRFGREIDTVAFRLDVANVSGLRYQERCHYLAGGDEPVRVDILGGGWTSTNEWAGGWGEVGGVSVYSQNGRATTTWTATFRSGCRAVYPSVPTTFVEGERVRWEDLWDGGEGLSEPAKATKFHGRDALRITFDLATIRWGGEAGGSTGTITYTVADGLPGYVAGEGRGGSDTGVWSYAHTLVGFAPGAGDAFALGGDARLPERAPGAELAPFDPLVLDDSGLELRFPFADAYAALRSDPRAGFTDWLDAHPRAILLGAWYQPSGGLVDGATEEYSWWIVYSEGTAAHAWYVFPAVTPPAGIPRLAPAPASVTDLGEYDVWAAVERPDEPLQVVDGGTVLATAAAHGVTDVAVVGYNVGIDGSGRNYAVWTITDVPGNAEAAEGSNVYVDAFTGGATGIATHTVLTSETGLLAIDPATDRLAATAEKTIQRIFGPGSGAGLAGALGAAAVLALVVKFALIPLYTRLRRDRLLDNPVRARLHEQVRCEPGIHRAALVDFAGIGEGATRHHLAQLVRHGLLVEFESEGYARYFVAGDVPPAVARREALLRAGSLRAVYDLYATEPDLTLRAAAARLHLSAPSVFRARRRLQKEGLLPAAPTAEVEA